MIFSNTEKTSILTRISFLESELIDLNERRSIDWKTYLNDGTARKALERTIENLVNAMIDVSKIVLSDRAAGEIPATYADAIMKLAVLKIIDFELAQRLGEHIKLRNFLAHEYLDLRWEKIKNFINQAPAQLADFITQVKKTIQ